MNRTWVLRSRVRTVNSKYCKPKLRRGVIGVQKLKQNKTHNNKKNTNTTMKWNKFHAEQPRNQNNCTQPCICDNRRKTFSVYQGKNNLCPSHTQGIKHITFSCSGAYSIVPVRKNTNLCYYYTFLFILQFKIICCKITHLSEV